MDMQFGVATIIIILGLGLITLEGGENEFFAGAGWGTLAMGCLWVVIRAYKAYKKK